MKKLISLLLILGLSLCLCACDFLSEQKEDVLFYYQRIDYSYRNDNGVIAPEERELAGYRDNLPYLMTLYFHGPLTDNLASPFPSGIAVMDIRTEENTMVVTLNSVFTQLKDLDLSIASICLAKTCFGLSDVQEVRIEALSTTSGENVSILITRDNYLLEDTIPAGTAPTENND